MGAIKKPNANRKALRHKVISFLDTPMNFHGFDDEVCIGFVHGRTLTHSVSRSSSIHNAVVSGTACVRNCTSDLEKSTLIESGHYLHQDTHRGYNGAQPVVQDLVQDFGKEDNDHLWPTLNRE